MLLAGSEANPQPSGPCVSACAHLVCVTTCTSLSVSVHVCASASHCWGPYLS